MTGIIRNLERLLYIDHQPRAYINGQWASYTDDANSLVVAALMLNNYDEYVIAQSIFYSFPKGANLRSPMMLVDILAPYSVEWFFRILSLDGQCDADYRTVWNGVRAQIETIAPDCFRSLDWRMELGMLTQ